MSNRLAGYAALVAAFVMWGSVGLWVRAIDADATTFVFADAVCTVIFLAPLLIASGKYREIASPRKLAITVGIGYFATLTGVLYYQAVKLTTVTNALLAHYTMPVFVVLLAPLLIGEQRRRSVLFALPVALLGLAAILPLDDLSLGNTDLVGITLGVASAIFYAFSLIGTRRLGGAYSALTVTWTMYLANATGLALFVLTQSSQVGILVQSAPFFILKGVTVATVPGLLFVWGLKRAEAQRASVMGFLEPLSGIVLAAVFLAEVPGFMTAIGGVLILGASYWVMRPGRVAAVPVEPGPVSKVVIEAGSTEPLAAREGQVEE